MSISVFPVPVTSSGATPTKKSIVATSSGVLYFTATSLPAGSYEVSTSTSTASVTLVDSAKVSLGSATAATTPAVINITTEGAGFYVVASSAGITVSVNIVASLSTPSAITSNSGTLDTITSTGNYTQTGLLYALAVGGGGGGGSMNVNFQNAQAASGGGSGGINTALMYSNGSIAVTIGTGGNTRGAGGATSFGNLTVNGGAGGNGNPDGNANVGNRQPGGTPGGGAGGSANEGNPEASASFNTIVTGTTGGGAAGNANNPAGSGIGTGGNGGTTAGNGAGFTGSGYGAGGGGGVTKNTGAPFNGGAGRPGVVYVLRGF